MGKSSIRQAATAALVAIAAFSMQPISAASAATPPQTEATTQSEDVTPIWFGNGCFWVSALLVVRLHVRCAIIHALGVAQNVYM